MEYGECAIHEVLARSLDVEKGDIIYIGVDVYQTLVGLINFYNNEVAVPKRLPPLKATDVQLGTYQSMLETPCRVRHLLNSTFGKVPVTDSETQVFMEY